MKSLSKGHMIFNAIDKFMPCYFKFINPIIHREKSREYGLNENQIKVLMAIDHVGCLTSTQLSHFLFIKKGSLTTIVRSLIELELINREDDPNDQRKYYLSLTEKGTSFVKDKIEENSQELGTIFKDMGEDDLYIVTKGLETLSKYLEGKGDEYGQKR
ncbi:MarR family winged helix-turn-helix transcriptional regulator [Anaeromicrobium sediminis]|uniref:HTH marR-type domain-containing protein n=1 Tax=Anaeromicrobium sediminis TaxID=1478221 RepID=A0A267MBH8_9FIRM|nr:MarR family transcriptional regulator [Anaeromicrobium sediminis]PAB56909.1 hypothetical protein CCE28_20050 [Anaeromicrobium sediminis]